MRIAVLVTSHNRVETTIRGLRSLFIALSVVPDVEARVFLVDDGSTDGTGERVREAFGHVTVVRGSGQLYWTRGMSAAYLSARASGLVFDAYLLFNDDVEVGAGLPEFFEEYGKDRSRVLVGACQSSSGDMITYSGFIRVGRLRPLAFHVPELTGSVTRVDTFNGNFVLFPAASFEALGGLDDGFVHGLGDLDLGLRATCSGVVVGVFRTPIGVCDKGPTMDERLLVMPRGARLKQLVGPVHGPRPYLRFARRHGIRLLFPLYLANSVFARLRLALR